MNRFRYTLSAGFAVLALALGAAVMAPSASATTGTLIITSNTTLTEDHHGLIEIVADGVTLDCAGHQVIASDPSNNTGVGILLAGRTGVTVQNCHVTGEVGQESSGFLIEGSSNNTLIGNVSTGSRWGFNLVEGSSNNTLSDNSATGMEEAGFAAVNGANDNTLTGNQASGGTYALFLVNVSGNTLTNNRGSGNGIQLGNGPNTITTGNTLIGNTSRGAPYSGFNFYAANGNTVMNNRAIDNDYAGFDAQSASDNAFIRNTATSNRHGFNVSNGSGNTFTRNIANRNREYGFVLMGGSFGNVVADSVARANGWYDAADYNAPGLNTWTNNNFGTTDPDGIG